MGSASSFSELTVTCNQCGSASMARLGPREYRCNHCGAITVVSQDQADRANAAIQTQNQTQVTSGPVFGGNTSNPAPRAVGVTMGTAARTGHGFVLLAIAVVIGLVIYFANTGSSPLSTLRTADTITPTVPANLVTLSSTEWSNDPNSSVGSGHYTGFLFNHSMWPIQVPRYTMTLYLRGIKGATAYSEAPVPRLMPGEYEPISFAFEAPSDDPHTEISGPNTVDRASAEVVQPTLGSQQLVREEGKASYRLVGVLTNNSDKPVASTEVLVMLFGANHMFVGYGRGYTRALRTGEQSAIEVPIPTSNVNPVLSYEYLVDAIPDTNS